MTRFFVIALTALTLSGCSNPLWSRITAPQGSAALSQGLDAYIASGDLMPLRHAAQQTEDPQEQKRVKAVLGLIETSSSKKTQLNTNQKKLTRCRQQSEQLKLDNTLLKENIEQLEQVLIDMESLSK